MSRYAYAAQAGGIAIFKSVGSAMQDVAVVAAVLDAAEKKRLGVSVPMYKRFTYNRLRAHCARWSEVLTYQSTA